MRKVVEFIGMLISGGLVVASTAGLFLFARYDQMVLFAGVVGAVAGVSVFSLFRWGRTWPARVGLVVSVVLTLGVCQTVPQWMPYLRAANPGGKPVDSKNGGPSKPNSRFEESAKKLTAEQFFGEHLDPAVKAISAQKGYTATFHKREWCKGLVGDFRLNDETITMKIRHGPFSAYLRFDLPDGKRGTEAIYVKDKNGGNVVAHSTTFVGKLLGTIRVPPDDAKIMADNRYPITSIGMKNLLLQIRKRTEDYQKQRGADAFAISLVEDRKVDERPCRCIEMYNPKPDEELPMASARLYLDREWNVPVGYESYERRDGKEILVEYYRYTNLKFDPGLKDVDFDPANPKYGYPK